MAASRSGGERMDCLRNSSRPMTTGAAATTAQTYTKIAEVEDLRGFIVSIGAGWNNRRAQRWSRW